MKLEQLIDSLLPNFKKSQLTEDIRLLREEVKTSTLPAYKTARELTRTAPFTSEFSKQFDAQAKRDVETYKDYFVGTIDTALMRGMNHLDTVLSLVDKHFEAEDVMRDALTFTKAHLIQFTELMQFLSSYSRRLLLVTVNLETNVLGEDFNASTSKDLQWLRTYQDAFLRGINVIAIKDADFQSSFAKLPDMLLTADSIDAAKQTVGASSVDPLKFGLIPYRYNPIYHVRLAVVRWQVSRQKLAAEEFESLELRLLHLRDKRTGKENPKLEKQIQYNQERIEKLRYKLHKEEEDADDE